MNSVSQTVSAVMHDNHGGAGLVKPTQAEVRQQPAANASMTSARSYGSDADIRPRRIGRVGIIGASTVACSLATALIGADIPVTMFESDRGTLDDAAASIRSGYRDLAAEGAISSRKRDRSIGFFAGTRQLHHMKDCDLIVEAAAMDAATRQGLFRKLDVIAKPGAVLATSAVDADISEIGRATRRSSDVLGLRFLGLNDTGNLFEVVLGNDTSPAVVATAIALAYETRSATSMTKAVSPSIRI